MIVSFADVEFTVPVTDNAGAAVVGPVVTAAVVAVVVTAGWVFVVLVHPAASTRRQTSPARIQTNFCFISLFSRISFTFLLVSR